MKTIIKEINLYTVNELSEKEKENARDDFFSDGDILFLDEDMNECLYEHLKANDMTSGNAEVMYSLSYSQGDGAMFTGTIEWKKKYIVTVKHEGHYYHYNSKVFDIERIDGEDIKNYSELEREFNNHYVNISRVLESHGYAHIKDYQSMDNFIEMCEANKYTFLENGKMCNE